MFSVFMDGDDYKRFLKRVKNANFTLNFNFQNYGNVVRTNKDFVNDLQFIQSQDAHLLPIMNQFLFQIIHDCSDNSDLYLEVINTVRSVESIIRNRLDETSGKRFDNMNIDRFWDKILRQIYENCPFLYIAEEMLKILKVYEIFVNALTVNDKNIMLLNIYKSQEYIRNEIIKNNEDSLNISYNREKSSSPVGIEYKHITLRKFAYGTIERIVEKPVEIESSYTERDTEKSKISKTEGGNRARTDSLTQLNADSQGADLTSSSNTYIIPNGVGISENPMGFPEEYGESLSEFVIIGKIEEGEIEKIDSVLKDCKHLPQCQQIGDISTPEVNNEMTISNQGEPSPSKVIENSNNERTEYLPQCQQIEDVSTPDLELTSITKSADVNEIKQAPKKRGRPRKKAVKD